MKSWRSWRLPEVQKTSRRSSGRIVVGSSAADYADHGNRYRPRRRWPRSARCVVPNLVQTAEEVRRSCTQVICRLIAHGCSSNFDAAWFVTRRLRRNGKPGLASAAAAKSSLDIKCRSMGVFRDVLVLVATLRALKMHGHSGETRWRPNAKRSKGASTSTNLES